MPFGASSREAVELRDGDPNRYGGSGTLKAAHNVDGELAAALRGRSFAHLAEADQAMRDLDGTPNKGRLGANAIVGTSMALAVPQPLQPGSRCMPTWPRLACRPGCRSRTSTCPTAGCMPRTRWTSRSSWSAPTGAPNVAEAVRAGAEVYAALRRRLTAGGHAAGLGDEGGFAPQMTTPEEVLTLITAAITDAGYAAGRDGVVIALDPAASEFRDYGLPDR